MKRRRHNHFQGHGVRRNTTAYIAINTRLCEACWKCVDACSKRVLGKTDFIFHKHARIINPGGCTGCLACLKACSEGAIAAFERERRPLR